MAFLRAGQEGPDKSDPSLELAENVRFEKDFVNEDILV